MTLAPARRVATSLAAVLATWLLAGLLLAPSARAEEPVRGRAHPPLRLPRIDGEGTLDLHALRGRKVLLIQFASW